MKNGIVAVLCVICFFLVKPVIGFAEEGVQDLSVATVATVQIQLLTEAQPAVKVATATTEQSNRIVSVQTIFTSETENFQKVREEKGVVWEKTLKTEADSLEVMVINMASDGEVTSSELTRLEKAVREYGWMRKDANKDLKMYGIQIAEDERAGVYQNLADIYGNHFLGDNKKESIRKFFVNLTGKDVTVKSDKIARGYITGWGIVAAILLVAAL